jgi:hypothetical protein
MKAFFAEHPEIRKDEVIAATKEYLRNFPSQQNPKYMQRADYFISKLEKGVPTSRLEMYLEVLKKQKENNIEADKRFTNQIV